MDKKTAMSVLVQYLDYIELKTDYPPDPLLLYSSMRVLRDMLIEYKENKKEVGSEIREECEEIIKDIE